MKVLRNDRYFVRKIDEDESPLETSTSLDHMKPWRNNAANDMFDESEEDDEEIEADI